MSKTQMKMCAGLEQVMKAIPAAAQAVMLDVGGFRQMFGLTSLGKKHLARELDDVLTTNGIVDQFGPWVMAEVESPLYQLSRLDDTHRVVFDDGPKGAPVELYVHTKPTKPTKPTSGPSGPIFHDEGDEYEEEDDPAIAARTPQELAAAKHQAQEAAGLLVKAKPGEDLRSLSPAELVKRGAAVKTVPKGDGLDFGWDISDAGPALEAEFIKAELTALHHADLIGPNAHHEYTFTHLRQYLAGDLKAKPNLRAEFSHQQMGRLADLHLIDSKDRILGGYSFRELVKALEIDAENSPKSKATKAVQPADVQYVHDLRKAFSVRERDQLKSMGLLIEGRKDGVVANHTLAYLRQQLKAAPKLKKPAPKAKRAK